jgi:hypothetical protein
MPKLKSNDGPQVLVEAEIERINTYRNIYRDVCAQVMEEGRRTCQREYRCIEMMAIAEPSINAAMKRALN